MNGQLDVINAWKGRTSCTSFVRCNDMWLAKDNRFLNPMSTYERNLMAPTCLIINNYYGATDILCFPFHHHCLAQPLIDSVDVWFPSSQSNNHMLALIINCGTKVSVMTSLLALMITSSSLLLSIGSIILESWNPCLYPRNSHHCLCSSSVFHCLNLVSSPCSLSSNQRLWKGSHLEIQSYVRDENKGIQGYNVLAVCWNEG